MIELRYIIIGIIVLLTVVCFAWWITSGSKTDTKKTVSFDEKDTVIPEKRTETSDQDFISSPSFIGRKPGYVFTRRKQGLGYYKDEVEMEKLK